jgi:hypothetical protein
MVRESRAVRGFAKCNTIGQKFTIECRFLLFLSAVGMNVRGNNIDCSNDCMETELQGCYLLHVCAKELLAESERAISATVLQCTDSDICFTYISTKCLPIYKNNVRDRYVGQTSMLDTCAKTLPNFCTL